MTCECGNELLVQGSDFWDATLSRLVNRFRHPEMLFTAGPSDTL